MKLAIEEKKTFLAGLQCTLTSSCAIISRTIETILLKLSTIVLHFMRIVYKKFR